MKLFIQTRFTSYNNTVHLIFFSVFSSVLVYASGECNFDSFYQELGCIALPRADNTTCPQAFESPDLQTSDPSSCYYRGVAYEDGATIPQNRIQNNCAIVCRCTLDGGPRFDCAIVDCVETFEPDTEECIASYDLDSCCSTGEVCGKEMIGALKTCEVDGKTYKEGQRFEPMDSSKNCVCTASWNGSLDDITTCNDINCGLEIYDQKNIIEKCAPVFVQTGKTCPFSYQCPTTKTKIIKGLNLRGSASQCFFGNMTLNFGDEVVVEDECTKCSCDVPPFVTCMKTAYTCGN